MAKSERKNQFSQEHKTVVKFVLELEIVYLIVRKLYLLANHILYIFHTQILERSCSISYSSEAVIGAYTWIWLWNFSNNMLLLKCAINTTPPKSESVSIVRANSSRNMWLRKVRHYVAFISAPTLRRVFFIMVSPVGLIHGLRIMTIFYQIWQSNNY